MNNSNNFFFLSYIPYIVSRYACEFTPAKSFPDSNCVRRNFIVFASHTARYNDTVGTAVGLAEPKA